MPPESSPINRKDFLNNRKPSSSDPVGIAPARWKELPITPTSQPNNHGPFSRGVGGGGGPSDIRRPFPVSLETTVPSNCNSHSHSDSVNLMDRVKLNDEQAKNNGDNHRLEKGNSLGSSLDLKPFKWTRSGSLSSRGSVFSQSVDFLESISGDAALCVTPRTHDDAVSRKKARLGWGEGLAKYEKKKVDPDDIVDKEAGARYEMVDDVSSSEPLLRSPSNLHRKSQNLAGDSECAPSTTPCSVAACGLSLGLQEKTSVKTVIVDNDTHNPLDDTNCPGAGSAMHKLQVWKADVSKKLEITETEIDSLENELKSFVSDVPEVSSSFPEASTSSVNLDIISILVENKGVANEVSDELGKILLPTTQTCNGISRVTDESSIKKKIAMRNRFLKFKERVIVLKFRALQYLWKEDLRLLNIRRVGAKSQKKIESGSRMRYDDHQRHRVLIPSRLSSPAVSSSPVLTTDTLNYVNKLLSDSRLRIYRKTVKMPSFILDKKERMSSRFISDNALVENPIDVEKEKSIVNQWTIQDKQLFLDKYFLFGKNFRKIATFFQHKTVADCVEFYYKNHKSDYFQKTKKNPEFAKEKSLTANTYLVGKQRLNRADVDVYVRDKKPSRGERLKEFVIYCNEQEAEAADVLAGICGSISSEALGSCITSSIDRCQKLVGSSLDDVDEETCSDDSCREEIDSFVWTDEEKLSLIKGVKSYGKDFPMISRYVKTRSSDQCRVFFSKARKCLGLDSIAIEGGSEVAADLDKSPCGEANVSSRESGTDFDLNAVSENVSSRIVQNPPERSLWDCAESSGTFLRGCSVTASNLSLDTEKPRNGDVKLFGQILTNNLHKVPESLPGGGMSLDRSSSYGFYAYARQESVKPFLLLPEIAIRKELEPLSGLGVSDPMTAIRLHYAKSQQYKNGGGLTR